MYTFKSSQCLEPSRPHLQTAPYNPVRFALDARSLSFLRALTPLEGLNHPILSLDVPFDSEHVRLANKLRRESVFPHLPICS
jgi:hypothetical protein